MNKEFFYRLRILAWAVVHNDVRYCRFNSPIALEIKRNPWKNSYSGYPALRISLTFQQPSIYLPSGIREAYDRRNWSPGDWEEWQKAINDIPF